MDGVLLAESSGNYAAAAYDRGFTLIGGRDIGGPLGWYGTAGTFAYYASALTPDAIRHHYVHGISSVIPEPAPLGLLLAGVGGAAWRGRHRA